jgi:hypothetical protein
MTIKAEFIRGAARSKGVENHSGFDGKRAFAQRLLEF